MMLSLLALNACKEDISPVPENFEYNRVFSAIGLEAEIENQTQVSLKWVAEEGVETYDLEIHFDSLEFANLVHTASVTADQLPYVFDCPAGDAVFSARIKANQTGLESSKWSPLAFKTKPENLFEGYEVKMDALNAVTISWKSGKEGAIKEVTSIAFVKDGNVVSTHDVSAQEMALGQKSVTGIANSSYQIKLMYNESVRGFQNYTMEGSVLLADGGDLAAAISSAAAGDVIVLSAAGKFGFIGDMTLDKSIKIKGLDGQALPVVYVTEGDRMFYIGAGLTASDSIVFENLHMSGATNLVPGKSDMIRGVFDQETGWPCDIALLKFQSCELIGFGRQILRFRGNDIGQKIKNFEIDDCIIRNLGLASRSYGVISSTASTANIEFVKITNSTIDSLRSHFIRYTDAPACQSILVENCSFNRTPYSDGRYFMDLNGVVFTGEGLQVNNCILGETSTNDTGAGDANGIRIDDEAFMSFNNSYATSDYLEGGYEIRNLLIDLGVASTGLWQDTENGDLSFRGEAVDAGDPRWKE